MIKLYWIWYWLATLEYRQMYAIDQLNECYTEQCHGITGYYYKLHRNRPPRAKTFLSFAQFKESNKCQ